MRIKTNERFPRQVISGNTRWKNVTDNTAPTDNKIVGGDITPANDLTTGPLNVTQRLIMQAGRRRSHSVGGKKIKRGISSNSRPRKLSLGSQMRIDHIFELNTKGQQGSKSC